MKLDGLYAAVLFPSLSPAQADYKEAESEGGEKSVLSQCRLLRKDDLLVSKNRIVGVGIKKFAILSKFKGRNFNIFLILYCTCRLFLPLVYSLMC